MIANKWTIGAKLWLLTGAMLVNLLLVGGFGYFDVAMLSQKLLDLREVQLPAVRNMTLADMMHDGIRANVFHALLISGSQDAAEINAVRNEASEFAGKIKSYLDGLEKLDLSPETDAALLAANSKVGDYVASAGEVIDLALAGKSQKARGMLTSFQSSFEALEAELGKLGDSIASNADASAMQARSMAARASLIAMAMMVGGLVFGVILSALIVRSLQKSLKLMVSQLAAESRHVTEIAGHLSTSSVTLSESTTRQASALQETAASVDEITAMVKKTAENSDELERSAQSNQQSATKGRKAMEEMLQAIKTISESNSKVIAQVEDGNQKITEIVKVIGEIGNKTKVINDIVFQTKLLSFNASVEAARAGEHGKGFAVVAEEVGNLAQMSGTAAKEISEMLGSSIHRVDGIVTESKRKVESLMAESRSKLEAGTSVAHQCEEALDEIVHQSSGVSTMISEISTAIREQNQGIQEISKALGLLDQSTHQNASTSHETSAYSERLLNQSQTLNGIVLTLQQMSGGAVQSGGAPEPRKENGSSPPKPETAAGVTTAGSNVLAFRDKPKAETVTPKPSAVSSLKMAAGGASFPDPNDPRFEEV